MIDYDVNMSHFNTILQWADKSRDIYGFDKINYEYSSFDIDLNEDYHILFSNEGEVVIEINRDLKEYAERLFPIEKERKIWIDNEIDSIIKTLKIELKSILTIIKRSKKTQKISVNLKNLPVIIISEK